MPADARRVRYRIDRMDCPTEEALIRHRLEPMPGIVRLDFNLMSRELVVYHLLDDAIAIQAALERIDMAPQLVEAGAPVALVPPAIGARERALLAVGGLAWGGTLWVLNRRLQSYDTILVAVVALLTGWGLLLQARLAPWSLPRQLLWLIVGCAALCAGALTPAMPRMLRRYRYTLLTAPMSGFYDTAAGEPNPGRTQMRIAYVPPPEEMRLVPRLFAELLERFLGRPARR